MADVVVDDMVSKISVGSVASVRLLSNAPRHPVTVLRSNLPSCLLELGVNKIPDPLVSFSSLWLRVDRREDPFKRMSTYGDVVLPPSSDTFIGPNWATLPPVSLSPFSFSDKSDPLGLTSLLSSPFSASSWKITVWSLHELLGLAGRTAVGLSCEG